MDAIDIRLKVLFSEDEPPARDVTFEARVAEARARRRLWADLGYMGLLTVFVVIGLVAFAPVLAPAAKTLAPALWPAALGLVLAAGAVWLATGRFSLGPVERT